MNNNFPKLDFSKIDVNAIGKKVLADIKKDDNRELREKILSVLPIWGDDKPSMSYAQVREKFDSRLGDNITKQLCYLKTKGIIRGKAGYCKRVILK